jgi:hypothetical protein
MHGHFAGGLVVLVVLVVLFVVCVAPTHRKDADQ